MSILLTIRSSTQNQSLFAYIVSSSFVLNPENHAKRNFINDLICEKVEKTIQRLSDRLYNYEALSLKGDININRCRSSSPMECGKSSVVV